MISPIKHLPPGQRSLPPRCYLPTPQEARWHLRDPSSTDGEQGQAFHLAGLTFPELEPTVAMMCTKPGSLPLCPGSSLLRRSPKRAPPPAESGLSHPHQPLNQSLLESPSILPAPRHALRMSTSVAIHTPPLGSLPISKAHPVCGPFCGPRSQDWV